MFLIVLYTLRIIHLSSFHNDQDLYDSTHTLLIFEIHSDQINCSKLGILLKMLYSGIVLDNDGLPAVLPEVLELRKGEICLQWANVSFFL